MPQTGHAVGAYLHRSLALSNFNASSGIDAIVVIRRDLRRSSIAAFQDLHRAPLPNFQRLGANAATLPTYLPSSCAAKPRALRALNGQGQAASSLPID